MTVKELRDALATMPDDLLVILQRDGEGNGYSPIAGADGDNNAYVADTTYSGHVRLRALTPEAIRRGYTSEDVAPDVAPPCLVLYPTN